MLRSFSTARLVRDTMCLLVPLAVLGACGIEADDSVPESAVFALDATVGDQQAPLTEGSISGSATASASAERLTESPSGSPSTGRILSRYGNEYVGVDLASGRYRTLDGTAELAGIGAMRRDANVQTRRDRSVTSGAVITVNDCLADRDDTICVLFTDREGDVRDGDFFALDGRFSGPAKVSHDGRYVMINRSDRAEALSVMSLFTRDGEFVASHAQSGYMDRSGPYDWLPDGRLVFAIEGSALLGDPQPTGFLITDPFDTTPQRRITLPAYYQEGSIETIESSPDGSQLLINVAPRVGPTRPILVDLDTLTVTQLIEREDGSVSNAKSVFWGPDGAWVYAVVATSKLLSGVGTAPGSTVIFIGSFDSLFAYRADGSTHPMPLDPDDLSDSVRLIPTDDPRRPGGDVGGGSYGGGVAWIP